MRGKKLQITPGLPSSWFRTRRDTLRPNGRYSRCPRHHTARGRPRRLRGWCRRSRRRRWCGRRRRSPGSRRGHAVSPRPTRSAVRVDPRTLELRARRQWVRRRTRSSRWPRAARVRRRLGPGGTGQRSSCGGCGFPTICLSFTTWINFLVAGSGSPFPSAKPE